MAWPPLRPSLCACGGMYPHRGRWAQCGRLASLGYDLIMLGCAVHMLSGPSISTTYTSEYCCGIRISRECPPGPGSQY